MMNFRKELELVIEFAILDEAEFTGAVDVPKAKEEKIERTVNRIMELIINRG